MREVRTHVEQDDIGDLAEGLALLAHVLLQVEQQRGVLLELLEREHVLQDDDAARGVRGRMALFFRERRPKGVRVVPLFEFSVNAVCADARATRGER